MKQVLTVILAALLTLLPWGVTSYATAGCGGSSGCGMSHTQSESTPAPQAQAGQYTCPMHPEVVSDKPGKCPKCGMALVKVQGKAGSEQGTDGITAQCQQIADEFAVLQDHFEMMMKLSDVGFLAEAMVKHQEMMNQFADHLAKHQETCQLMAAGTTGPSAPSTSHSSHAH